MNAREAAAAPRGCAEADESVEAFPAPYAILRFGGLPIEELDALRFDRTTAWRERGRALEVWFAKHRDALSAVLHDAAPAVGDARVRSRLLDLRRAAFNDRVPKNMLSTLRALRPYLARTARQELLQWCRRIRLHARLAAGLSEVFAAELHDKRAALRRLVSQEAFLKGVQLSSLEFYDALANRRTSPGADQEPLDPIEVSAMLYLARMATKPSPWSTFTPTALGLVDRATRGNAAVRLGVALKTRVRFNAVLVHRVARALARHPAMRSALSLRVRDGFWMTPNDVCFIKPSYGSGAWRARDDAVRRIPRTPAITGLLSRLSDGRSRTYGQAVDELRADGDSAVVRRALDKLIDVGLLVSEIDLSPFDEDPLSRLYGLVAERGDVALALCRAALRRITDAVALFGPSPAPRRRELLQTIRDSFGALAQELSLDAGPELDLVLVREDCATSGVSFALGGEITRPLEESLVPLMESLRLGQLHQAPELRRRVATARARGPVPPVPFLVEYCDAEESILHGKSGDAGALMPLLIEAQARLAELSARALRAAQRARSDQAEIDLGSPNGPPRLRGWPASITAFVQIAAANRAAIDRGDYLIVLNRAYSGFGHCAARFCGLYGSDAATDPLTEMLRGHLAQLSDREVVELSGFTDSSDLQRHPRLTGRTLAWPGEPAVGHGLSFAGLLLSYDATRDAVYLVERDSGKELLPIYLGGIQPIVLPRLLATAIKALTPMALPFARDFWAHLDEGAAVRLASSRPGVVRLPRVRLRNLVLARAGWRIDAALIPLPMKGESDARHFARLQRWREEVELPERVFVRPDWDGSIAAIQSRHYKPMFLDFRNPWLGRALSRALGKGVTRAFFTEVLPGPDQLPVTWAGRPVASELQIEWSWKATDA